jgi:hypothetical protein
LPYSKRHHPVKEKTNLKVWKKKKKEKTIFLGKIIHVPCFHLPCPTKQERSVKLASFFERQSENVRGKKKPLVKRHSKNL